MHNPMKKRKQCITAILLVLCTLLTSVWFYFTYARAEGYFVNGEKDRYYDASWDCYSESLVMGRIYQMQLSLDEQNPKGFLCSFIPSTDEGAHVRTRRAYLADGDVSQNEIYLYTSGIGAQGTLQGIINLALCAVGMPAMERYYTLRFLAIFMFFAMLMAVCVWLKTELGILSGVTAFFVLTLASWTKTGVMNLYWLFWTYLAPMVACIFLCHAIEKNGKAKWWHFMLLGGTLLLKFCFGFEFTSTLLVCMELPVVYYLVKHWKERRRWVKVFLVTGALGLAMFTLALAVWAVKMSFYAGSVFAALQDIKSTITFRTGAFAQDPYQTFFNGSWSGLDATAGEVVSRFLWDNEMFSGISMGVLTVAYMGALAILAVVVFMASRAQMQRILLRHTKLVLWVACSYLAPISWYVLARGHSMVHTHIAHFLWLFPTMIFVVAHMAVCARDLYQILLCGGTQDAAHKTPKEVMPHDL